MYSNPSAMVSLKVTQTLISCGATSTQSLPLNQSSPRTHSMSGSLRLTRRSSPTQTLIPPSLPKDTASGTATSSANISRSCPRRPIETKSSTKRTIHMAFGSSISEQITASQSNTAASLHGWITSSIETLPTISSEGLNRRSFKGARSSLGSTTTSSRLERL